MFLKAVSNALTVVMSFLMLHNVFAYSLVVVSLVRSLSLSLFLFFSCELNLFRM